MIARLSLALFAIFGGIAIAWMLSFPHLNAHAAGFTEVPTKTEPAGVAFDTHGHIWVAEPACDASPTCGPTVPPGNIGEYNTSDSSLVQDFTSPAAPQQMNPLFDAIDASGNAWFTDPTHNLIGKLIPANPPVWNSYTVPTPLAAPYDLTFDNNGNIWFTEQTGNKIGFVNTHVTPPTMVENAVPTASSEPYGITKAPDGDIWFAENGSSKIGSFTPTTNGTVTIAEHPIDTGANPPSPHMITSDSVGNLWYSEGVAGKVGEFNPTNGSGQDFTVSGATCPSSCASTFIAGIGVGNNGLVWFDDSLNSRIGVLDPTNGAIAVIALSSVTAHPYDGLAVDSNNNTWFTELFADLLGKIPAGSITPTPTGTGTSGTPTPTPTGTGTPTPSPTPGTGNSPVSKNWYLAEGKVGAGFTEFITIENPDPVNSCTVNIQYLLGSGSPVTKTVIVKPASRFTEYVNGDLGTMPNSSTYKTVSTIVSVDSTKSPNCAGVVAERPMYFTNFAGVSSGSDVLGTIQLGTTFYFADMPTGGGYASFLTILNPPTNGKPTVVTATYYANGQATGSPQTVTVQPGQRGTIIPNNAGSLRHQAVLVTSNQPVAVERPTYFSNVREGNAQTVSGAASAVGVQTLAKDWLFAEGYTGGQFQQYFVLANFGAAQTTASVTLEYSNGHTQVVSVLVPALGQAFVDVNYLNSHLPGTCDTNPCQPTQDLSAEITSSGNIIASRELYFRYNHVANGRTLTAMGGTDVLGEAGAATSFSFAEGYTNKGYDEWLTLQNPTNSTEVINVTLVNEDGRSYSQGFSVVPHSRFTIDVVALVLKHLIVPKDTYRGYEISIVVQSSSGSFMAERPMYWNTNPRGTQGGSDVIGFTGQ
ncbi:MAG: hypothetical protein NVS3B14_05140 [Ktedonobacteraceae bacterium]